MGFSYETHEDQKLKEYWVLGTQKREQNSRSLTGFWEDFRYFLEKFSRKT